MSLKFIYSEQILTIENNIQILFNFFFFVKYASAWSLQIWEMWRERENIQFFLFVEKVIKWKIAGKEGKIEVLKVKYVQNFAYFVKVLQFRSNKYEFLYWRHTRITAFHISTQDILKFWFDVF